eukprot:COSAG01_NODE_5776_length_4039_cov_11.750761_5_plen_38_part_01
MFGPNRMAIPAAAEFLGSERRQHRTDRQRGGKGEQRSL